MTRVWPITMMQYPTVIYMISEFMKDPTAVGDTAGEWIEIYNAGAFDVNLEGWALADAGSNFHVISTGGAGLIVPPGGRAVLVNTGRDQASLRRYDVAMGARFAGKDVVSLLVQRFLEHPPLFEYAARRLATRERVRATMGLVMGDLVPASRGLDPRFLARLLAP